MERDNSPVQRVVAECFAGRFRILNRVVTGAYDDALRPFGVRISQMNVLVAVAARGPVRAAEVCRMLKLDKSTLSRDLDRLIDRGWIQSTPAEGRGQNLTVTPAGTALIERTVPAWEEAQERVRELLGPKLLSGVVDAIGRLPRGERGDRS